ncbi:putative NADH dehydrogenase [ubiquinone] 1 beta subcomplex subunit 5, mitochondrial [Hypsibius exemplaris]|uniref:NADH dehydrogenase [ubiquinone] 1 beta subcomplex subunit 5, mitochondrial n=1 Tax=Hypsibius exemplaris TaxID=2072580 RepID=A0A9X6NCI3_HYPEX|nr:putative NADH dehydrogenase [ubiquinone] 1 beta subcomplex subunit 5, mitochondrial [Hypsibius exemplaris]
MALCLRISRGALSLPLLRGGLTAAAPLKAVLLQQSPKNAVVMSIVAREMSGKRLFILHPSRFVWRRFRRDLHFFVMIAVIPLSLITLYFNLVVGPADLAEIPEGYIPREWEYYKHPVSRFIVKYYQDPPQKCYEQVLQMMYEQADVMRVRRLEAKIDALQAERMDYMGYYTTTGPTTRYMEKHREEVEEILDERRMGGQTPM